MSMELVRRGYDLVSVDAAPDMLSEAAAKCSDGNPLWLCQTMQRLDLNDVVDAAVCCFDSVNYLPNTAEVRRMMNRVRLFLRPGGLFVFDVRTPEAMAAMHGQCYYSDSDDAYCTWRPVFSRGCLHTDIDLFVREGQMWRRCEESHLQRAYTEETLTALLAECGFRNILRYGELSKRAPTPADTRWYFTAVRSE